MVSRHPLAPPGIFFTLLIIPNAILTIVIVLIYLYRPISTVVVVLKVPLYYE